MAPKDKKNGIKALTKDGFTTAGAGENAAWAKMTEGAVWCGELVGSFTMSKPDKSGKKRMYYQLLLTDAPFKDSEGEEHVPMGIVRDPETEEFSEEPIALNVGDLVNIDSRWALDQALLPLVKDMTATGSRYKVIVQALEKKNLDGGTTMWRFNTLKALLPKDAPGLPF